MNTSESCAVVRSFILFQLKVLSYVFLLKNLEMLKTPLFNKNLEVPTSYSSLENSDQCISKDI